MLRRMLLLALFALAACKRGEDFKISSNPTSVRGWVMDVKGARRGETIELELARRTELFANTSVWVENVAYATGGIAENGSFIVLDVPPENATLGFNAPGAETGRVELRGVPANADVLIPSIILQNGGATVHDPSKILVRIGGDVDKPRPTGKTAKVAGYDVPIMEVPMASLEDRRQYPPVPGYRPVATVR
ncbi:MAG TPA: hypothetical protein VM733_16280 [Thermoanaerobaculia bacterium]|nr:hypothetical protein [Thermoanaerobaculia bacterium]